MICTSGKGRFTDDEESRTAMRRRMCDYKTWTHFLGAAMFIPGG